MGTRRDESGFHLKCIQTMITKRMYSHIQTQEVGDLIISTPLLANIGTTGCVHVSLMLGQTAELHLWQQDVKSVTQHHQILRKKNKNNKFKGMMGWRALQPCKVA